MNKELSTDFCKKNDDVIMKIISSYKKEQQVFRIGGKSLRLEAKDIKLIFGICCGSEQIRNQYQKKDLVPFKTRRNVTDRAIETRWMKEQIESLVGEEDEEDVADVVRIVCMLLFVTVFFAGRGTTLKWTYVQFLEDIDNMQKYDWAQEIVDVLLKSIKHYDEGPKDVAGCVIALPVKSTNVY
ncbi:hypothetical protein Vadar_001150 [Vaccinium darrowii]|uniref:Uncharacterized protein n=1 Tax=Vaccinium darrowii TaxID=229202 RepID=A0ACB7WWY7_9ERIC|nr:hypothetical protein Vadar_001150 [Vaccinium darrowii]